MVSLFAGVSENIFHRLQLSTTADTTRLATLLVGLDEKVDRLDDTLDGLEYGDAARARAAELVQIRKQVDRLEAKLDKLLEGPGARPTWTVTTTPTPTRRSPCPAGSTSSGWKTSTSTTG